MVTKLNGQFFGSNSYIIKNNNSEALIIDACVSAEEIKKYVKGFKVVAVLLTHLHFDHSYFLNEIITEFKCPIYVSEKAKKYLLNADLTLSNAFNVNFVLPTNFNYLTNQQLNLGSYSIKVFLTPGHSPDSACFLIGSMLFCGDTLFLDAIGRTDFKLSSVSDMLNSLKLLKDVKFDIALSGHGKQSSFSDQQKNIEYFIDLLTNLN